jgi:hypothetical protein
MTAITLTDAINCGAALAAVDAAWKPDLSNERFEALRSRALKIKALYPQAFDPQTGDGYICREWNRWLVCSLGLPYAVVPPGRRIMTCVEAQAIIDAAAAPSEPAASSGSSAAEQGCSGLAPEAVAKVVTVAGDAALSGDGIVRTITGTTDSWRRYWGGLPRKEQAAFFQEAQRVLAAEAKTEK